MPEYEKTTLIKTVFMSIMVLSITILVINSVEDPIVFNKDNKLCIAMYIADSKRIWKMYEEGFSASLVNWCRRRWWSPWTISR